jgi:hypothetical protein
MVRVQDRSRNLLVYSTTAAPVSAAAVTAEGASGATITTLGTYVIPPTREAGAIKLHAEVAVDMAAGSTAQQIFFDIRASGQTDAVAEDAVFPYSTVAVNKTETAVIDTIIDITRGGSLKIQAYGAAADANTLLQITKIVIEAI